MAEYIERDAVIGALYYSADECCSASVADIEAIPASDVTPVRRGKWKYYHKQNRAVCTECSFDGIQIMILAKRWRAPTAAHG